MKYRLVRQNRGVFLLHRHGIIGGTYPLTTGHMAFVSWRGRPIYLRPCDTLTEAAIVLLLNRRLV